MTKAMYSILMNMFDLKQLIIIIGCATLFLLIALFLLGFSHRKLKLEHKLMLEQMASINRDLAGLCSAAVHVDTRLAESTTQVNSLVDRIDNYGSDDIVSSAYQSVIEKVQEGISEQDIIKECGLSREEAALLIKLHG